MLKKLLIFVLCLAVTLSTLVGCSLFADNDEANSLQVIARVAAVSASGNDRHVLNEDGYYEYTLDASFDTTGTAFDEDTVFYVKNDEIFTKSGEQYLYVYDDVSLDDLEKRTGAWQFSVGEKNIYKYQLYSYINSYGDQYMQNYDYTIQEVVELFVDQLITREVVLNEAEKAIAKGDIVLGNEYENAVNKSIYKSIDSQYSSYLNVVLKENDLDPVTDMAGNEQDTTATETTYPLYPYTDTLTDGEVELWNIKDTKNAAKWPGMGSGKLKSSELEAMRRLLNGYKSILDTDFRLTKNQRTEINKSFEEIDKVINTQGLERVYPMLGDTYLIEYLYGKSAVEEQKIALMQAFIVGEIEATDDDILKEFERTKKIQSELYSEDIQNYYTASSEKLVVINPDPYKHIYVKHILVKFSEAQEAELAAYKALPTATEDGLKQLRDRLASEIVGYEHVDGEDDLSKPITIDKISREIRSQMGAASTNPKQAERTFDRLIYKYNQDPGIFDNALGYAVIGELANGEQDTYVAEFSKGARELGYELNEDGSNKYKIGDVLDYDIVTDFGVHFMYYSYSRPAGTVSLHDYVTNGEYETYYDLVKTVVEDAMTAKSFEDWASTALNEYKEVNKDVTIYTKRYKDVYKNR